MSRPAWRMTGGQQLCRKDCPRRRVGCREECPSWAEHERQKRERYERKRLEHATERPDDLLIQQAHERKKRQR